jgi:hypothetical protein
MGLQINYACTHAWSEKGEKRLVTAAYHLIGAHVMVATTDKIAILTN